MRACLVVILIIACSPGEPVRAQSGTDVSPAIPVHPDVPTILQLPDAIERVWTIGGDEVMVQGVGSEVYVRPRPGTPAGVEAFVEVETRTLHRMFLVRVVARAEDARREVVVSATPAVTCVEEAERAAPAAPPAPAAPAACAPSPAPEPTEPASARVEPEPTAPEPTAAPARAAEATMPPPFDLSAHAVIGLGFTALDIAEYEPETALQPHQAFGLRLAGTPRGRWFSLEASVSGEWPYGPMRFMRGQTSQLEVTGARLRAEVGVRAGHGTTWHPSVYAGIGAQAHLRRTVETFPTGSPESTATMARGAVLALGLGLQHRARPTLLGLDFQLRQGGPDGYVSVSALLTWGRFLDQGE